MQTVDVIFKKPFNAIPTIVCTLKSGSNITTYGDLTAFVDYGSVTKKGFTIKVSNSCATLGAKPCVSWIATVLWNSNRLSAIRIGANSETTIPLQPYCSALVLGTAASHINGFYLISRKPDTVSITPLIDGLKNTDFQVTVVDSALIAIKTQSATDMRVIYMK